MEQQELIFQLCETDEQIVRTYECTRLRRFLVPATIGFLTITNKRIVFHSKGKSLSGHSLLINEMPLEDTAGVNAYLDISVNWIMFAVIALGAFFITSFLRDFAPFFVSWFFAFVIMFPFCGIWLLNSNLLNEQVHDKIFTWTDEKLQNKAHLVELLPVISPFAHIAFLVGVAILAFNIAFAQFLAQYPWISFIFLFLCYFGIYITTVGQQRTFCLTIGSKTRKGSGIFIPGTSLLTILTRDTTAPDTLGAQPAKDAEKVTRELGALLMDIRQLGDIGIQKWKS